MSPVGSRSGLFGLDVVPDEVEQLRGERGVLVVLLVECDKVLSTLEGESSEEQAHLDALRMAILRATQPHRAGESDLLSVRMGLGGSL